CEIFEKLTTVVTIANSLKQRPLYSQRFPCCGRQKNLKFLIEFK
ncbi:hypothetical protein DOY81_010409, partial [Sarcophaga bullata]